MIQLAALKSKLPEYLHGLGAELRRESGHKLTCCCPIHQERTPSFTSSLQGEVWVFKCFGCGASGTVLDLHAALHNLDVRRDLPVIAEAVARQIGTPVPQGTRPCPVPLPSPRGANYRHLELPKDSTEGTLADWEELARLRHLSVIATATAALHLGTLRFGTVCGHRSWILTDAKGVCAEARRMDGQLFPAYGPLRERKAHTLPGSRKNWPVGLAINGWLPSDFRSVLMVEGAPDYLAALNYTMNARGDCLPVAILGAGVASELHPDAIKVMAGLRVRFYPHADLAGQRALEGWARQLRTVAKCEMFSFAGLRRKDGIPVKDLNDTTQIHPDDLGELKEVLP